MGIALALDYLSASALQAGRLVKLNDMPFVSPRAYFLVATNERAKAPVIQSLRQWLTGQSPPGP